VPCIKVARGVANPAVIPPFATPSAPSVPFNDTYDNTPCGKSVVGTIQGVDMTPHQLCVFHLGMKLGLAEMKLPRTIESPG